MEHHNPDSEELVESENSGILLLVILIGGLAIIAAQMYGGFVGWPVYPTVIVGGIIQTLFLIGKRYLKNLELDSDEDRAYLDSAGFSVITNFALVFAVSVFSSAVFYLMGQGPAWLLR